MGKIGHYLERGFSGDEYLAAAELLELRDQRPKGFSGDEYLAAAELLELRHQRPKEGFERLDIAAAADLLRLKISLQAQLPERDLGWISEDSGILGDLDISEFYESEMDIFKW